MGKFVGVLLGLGTIVGLVLGFWSLIWLLWGWVMPQVWPAGPDAFVRPGFWLFVGVWMLMTFIGKAIFGGGRAKSE